MFDDMRTGWLSEAGGEYVLTFAQYVQDRLPKFAELKIGQRFVLASQTWTVSNIEERRVRRWPGRVAVQGRGRLSGCCGRPENGANFATLDYSETPPLLVRRRAGRLSGR
jgi:hypothetical protein